MLDDAQLLRRYAEEKSEAAFAELVARHLDLVYSAALRQVGGDAHHAHDVAQVVFTTLARKAASVAEHPVLLGWLYTATQHTAAKIRRAEARRHAREREAHLMHELTSLSAPTVDWERVRPVLDDAMRELPDRDREAVLLRFFAQRPFAEIGAALQLSEDAARMRVERALDKLHALLARRGVTSTSAALAAVLANQAVAGAPAGLAASVTSAALTSAGTMSVVVNSIFHLMSSTKIITGIAVIVALLTLGGAVVEMREAQRARAELGSVRDQRDQLQHRVANLETQVRETTAVAANVEKSNSVAAEVRAAELASIAQAKKAAEAQIVSSSLLRASNPLGSLYALRGNPEAMESWLKAERSGLDLQMGPLFQSLGLSTGQVDRCKDILMEKFQTVADVIGAAQSQELDLSNAAIKLNFKGATDKAENDLRALLGPTGYEQLQQYGATTEVREIVRGLAGDVYHTDTPLSTPQANRLMQVIANNSQQSSAGYRVDTTNWSNVLRDASDFLSPAQLVMLRAESDQRMLRQQLDSLSKPIKPPGK